MPAISSERIAQIERQYLEQCDTLNIGMQLAKLDKPGAWHGEVACNKCREEAVIERCEHFRP